MRRRRGFGRWLRLQVPGAREAVRDVDAEVQLHIELRVRQLVSEGWDAASAEAEARRRFARSEGMLRRLYGSAKARNRHMRMRQHWDSVLLDTRYAVRGLVRDPLLATFVALTLALGIGANVTAFSLVDHLLVRDPAHVRDADGLARLYARTSGTAGEQTSSWLPWATYNSLRETITGFEALGAYRVREAVVGSGVAARVLRVGQTAGAFYSVLGVQPLLGRFPGGDEDAAESGPLVVLSEPLWRRDFAGEAAAIGSTLRVGDEPHTVVGVAPVGFTGAEPWRVDAWVVVDPRTAPRVNWHVVGRLRPGVTLEALSAEANAVHGRTSGSGPRWMVDARLSAAPIRFDHTGREPTGATMARWLAGVSAMILLITWANVVNLLLVRLVRRRRELAIRIALGSGRGRVARLVVFEGALLAVVSGLASLGIAQLAEPIVRRALFADDAGWTFSLVDARLIGMLLVLVTLTALVAGTAPALQAGDRRLMLALRSSVQAGGAGSHFRSVLTVVQATLCVVLLMGAGLFVRSLTNARSVDLGVDTEVVVTAQVSTASVADLRTASFSAIESRERDLYLTMADRVRQLPGVERAAVAVGLPLDGGSFSAGLFIPGRDSVPSLPGRGPYASKVSSGYFDVVGTRLLRGRGFTTQEERALAEPVVIVAETMARTLWPGRDALEGCVHIARASAPCSRVVGIVQDVHRTGLREETSLQYYMPLGQEGLFAGATLVVRPLVGDRLSWPLLRQAILEVDPSILSVDVRLLGDALEGEVRPLRLGLVTFGLSGTLALLVAVLGLYSVMAYTVAWRTREIGIRVALGATASRITSMVVGSGAALAALGILLGLVLGSIGGRWLEPHLFETSAADPLVLAGVASVLFLVALLAGVVPAQRALRISPTEALRED